MGSTPLLNQILHSHEIIHGQVFGLVNYLTQSWAEYKMVGDKTVLCKKLKVSRNKMRPK